MYCHGQACHLDSAPLPASLRVTVVGCTSVHWVSIWDGPRLAAWVSASVAPHPMFLHIAYAFLLRLRSCSLLLHAGSSSCSSRPGRCDDDFVAVDDDDLNVFVCIISVSSLQSFLRSTAWQCFRERSVGVGLLRVANPPRHRGRVLQHQAGGSSVYLRQQFNAAK